jgi:MFS family permease
MASLQAITGINSVVFYSTTIFGLAGFSQAIIGTSLVGAINVGATIVTSRLIDKTGRKILLLCGTYTMLFSLIVLSVVLVSPVDETTQGIIAVLAVLLFVLGFAFGLGAGK